MAKPRTTMWVGTFRIPADNFEHEHVVRVRSVGESLPDARAVLIANTNADIRIEKLYRMEDTRQLDEETARAIREGGPGYRGLQGSEQFLTARKARELREDNGLSVSNLNVPDTASKVDRALSEAKADAFANPPIALPA